MTIAAGTYKGRGVAGSEQYGVTSNNNDQIVIDLDLAEIGMRVSTFLIFTDKAAQFSIDRLRALGWIGNDLSKLEGIDRNEVDVIIKYEQYNGKTQMRVEILTGGGRVKLDQPMNEGGKRAFAARYNKLAASQPAAKNPGGEDFPFGANQPPQRAGGDIKF